MWNIDGMILTVENRTALSKHCPLPFCPLRTPRSMMWDGSRAFVVRGLGLPTVCPSTSYNSLKSQLIIFTNPIFSCVVHRQQHSDLFIYTATVSLNVYAVKLMFLRGSLICSAVCDAAMSTEAKYLWNAS